MLLRSEMPETALHAFDDSRAIAEGIARRLPAASPLRAVEVHGFPDGESRVRVDPRGGDLAVLVRTLCDPNRRLVELLFAADALRRGGVRELVLVAPYLGYMRQDTAFRPGEAISQRVVASLLSSAFDRVLTVEAHLHRIRRLGEVFRCPATSISAAPLFAERYRDRPGDWCIVGPDEESMPWVEEIARRAGCGAIVGRKQRRGDRRVEISLPPTGGATHAVVVDDVASSGETLCEAARALRASGVGHVEAAVVHALFAPDALARMRAAGIEEVISTDTVPHASNRIGVAPLLADALRASFRDRISA